MPPTTRADLRDIDWSVMDTALIDMDGVLLDLHFDDRFWGEWVPQHYAQLRGLGDGEARRILGDAYRRHLGTLKWYCVDHWSAELGLDIMALKRARRRHIRLRPGAVDFLRRLKRLGKRRILVSNAHRAAIDLKLEHSGLNAHLDEVCCSHQLGLAKEQPGFWQRFFARYRVAPDSSLLIDDNEAVLANAAKTPIAALLTVAQPSSAAAPRDTGRFVDGGDLRRLFPLISV